jgi:hypothetical protein
VKYQIKQLGLGGILDQAFSIIRNHFGLLFGIVAVTIIPLQIVIGFLQNHLQQTIKAGGEVQPLVMLQVFSGLFVAGPVSMLVNAAVIFAVANLYLSRPTTIPACFGHALQRLLPLIGTSILTGLVIFAGFLLLIIPGILFAFWYALSQHVTVLESMAGGTAMARSKALMKGNIGTAFALGLLLWVIIFGLSLAAGVIPQIHSRIFVAALIQGLVTLIATATFVVFYFSCRCKAENFDLQVLADAIGEENVDDANDDDVEVVED